MHLTEEQMKQDLQKIKNY